MRGSSIGIRIIVISVTASAALLSAQAWGATRGERLKSTSTTEDRMERRPAVGLSYTMFDPRGIFSGVLDSAGATGMNRSRILSKGRPMMTPALRVAYDFALFDALPIGRVASLVAHAGGFAEFSSTELVGGSLRRHGDISFDVPMRAGSGGGPLGKRGARSSGTARGIELSAEYAMTGSLTSYRLGGRADTTAWLGRGPYRVGARLRILAGAMVFMGKAKFSTWLSGLSPSNELAAAEVEVLGAGPMFGGSAGPVIKMRQVECGGGLGFQYERTWVSVSGDFAQIGGDATDVSTTIPLSNLGKSFDLECALPF